jgi:hypothetical protein
MSTALAPAQTLDPTILQAVFIGGDLSALTPAQRLSYYLAKCGSLDLNEFNEPFLYVRLQGKLQLYPTKNCTDQLRFNHGVSIAILAREVVEGCYIVTAQATLPSGRADVAIGAVAIDGLKGENRANAMMKAETKAKRRATLSITGMSGPDESELDSIPGAERVPIETSAVPASPGILTSELPESSATAPAKRGVAPSAPTPAPSAPDSGNAPVTTSPVVVLDAKVGNRTPPHYYEIVVKETEGQPFEPAREHVLITKDEALYKIALEAHGTGLIFDATWHDAKRTDGKRFLALDALEVVQ